mmetsp:Transcript_11846/g.31134  ORF Transcript_11846/g.31134 Transcript_11846/m.31134 type:complete len:86 (-) Transcript_11846:550-807(-)
MLHKLQGGRRTMSNERSQPLLLFPIFNYAELPRTVWQFRLHLPDAPLIWVPDFFSHAVSALPMSNPLIIVFILFFRTSSLSLANR